VANLRLRLATAMAVASLGAAALADVPKVLIIQSSVPVTKDGDPNLSIANFLAQEVDDGGRLSSVVWSITDPNFRQIIDSGKIKDIPDIPKLADALKAAKQWGVEYVVLCVASRAGGDAKSVGHLYKNGREVWNDKVSMRVGVNDSYDREATALSIAHTLVLKMTAAALKDLPVRSINQTPAPAQGQLPAAPHIDPPVPEVNDDEKLWGAVNDLVQGKHMATAITTVRDAIDAQPFNPDRRKKLIELLQTTDPAAAAAEAIRGCDVIPEDPTFRIMAARAYMQAGKNKEAQEALNEAIARAPDAPATRLMLAELDLRRDNPEKALENVDLSLKAQPSLDGYFIRALCRAELGGADGVALDFAEIEKLKAKPSSADTARRYQLAISILDRLLLRTSEGSKELISHATVKPKDADVKESLATTRRQLGARIKFLAGLAHPADAQSSFDRWLLAYKLMDQAMSDLESFIGGSPDSLVDSRINLGESLKQIALAKAPPPDPVVPKN